MTDAQILEIKKTCLLEAGKYSTSIEQLIENYKKIVTIIGLPV